jgi:hypothetical protein
VAAVGELAVEETNLADALRAAVAVPDPSATAELASALVSYWTIRGENTRVIAMAVAVDDALKGWEPAPDEVDAAVIAAALIMMNTVVGEVSDSPACLALLERYGPDASLPRARGLVAVVAAQVPRDHHARMALLREIDVAQGYDQASVALARLLSAHYLENDGYPELALEEATSGLALVDDADGPWAGAMMRAVIGGLHAQLGNRKEAAVHARAAIPVLDALHAADDAIQARSLLAGHAIGEGRFADAEQLIAEIDVLGRDSTGGFGGAFVTGPVRAELALARGEIEEGLRLYRVAGQELSSIRIPGLEPNGLEPWTLVGEAVGATAYALHGTGAEGVDLFEALRGKLLGVVDPDRPHMDYPVAGLVLHGLGVWGLLKGGMDAEDAVELLVLAEQFAYPRFTVSLDPERTDEQAELAAPGLTARLREEYGARRGPDLLVEARALAERVG